MLVRGLVALAVGIYAFARPGQLFTTVLVFGALAVVAGILAIVHAVGLPPEHAAGRWPLLGEGIVGLAAGTLAFEFVRHTIFLAYTLGGWAIAVGAGILGTAGLLRSVIPFAWLWALVGIAIAALGLGIVLDPRAATLGPAYLLGAIATAIGVGHVILGFGLLRHAQGQMVAPSNQPLSR